MKPVIGITSSFVPNAQTISLHTSYLNAITRAGGLPFVVPAGLSPENADQILAKVDGLLFSGGADIDPQLFNQNPHPLLGEVSPERDRIELPLMRAAVEKDVPVLGVCRGAQLLNVALGGTLYQDLGREVSGSIKHVQKAPMYHASHSISIMEDSKLARLLGVSEIRVNSFHHQSIKNVAPGLNVSATAPDGIVEAVESSTGKAFVMGVQWHPEAMIDKVEAFLGVFEGFLKAARAS